MAPAPDRKTRLPKTPAPAPAAGAAARKSVRIADPKGLRRFLDRILSSPSGPADDAAVGDSLASALAELGPKFGVRAIGWYTEDGNAFVRQRAVGADVGFAPRVDAEVAVRLGPKPRRARVFLDVSDPEGPAALGLLAPGASAVLRFDSPPNQSLALVALTPDADAQAVEFVLGTIASAVSARALQERWRRSLEHAAEIQRGLLPTSLPQTPGLVIAARSIAAEDVGGDLFDFFPFGQGVLGVAVGDASGHGLPAALVARDVVVGLRVGLDRGMRIAGVLARLNRVLRAGIPESAFASLFYVEIRPDGELEYVCAGHPPALRVRRVGYTALRQGGPVLGPLDQVAYRRTAARLERGETLVLYTDGITERRSPDGALFGEERLAAEVAALADRPVEGVIDGVIERVRAFGGGTPWVDDLTLVVIRRVGRPSRRPA
jgi:hypothetical protein